MPFTNFESQKPKLTYCTCQVKKLPSCVAREEIALVCGLKVRLGCQDGLCVNSDADETLA